MKNRLASIPFASIPPNQNLLARTILVFFDDKQQNSTIKRLAIVIEKESRAFIIDSKEQIGIIDVLGNQDGYGNILWAPKERIGLLRRLSSEKLLESGPPITDPKVIKVISAIRNAEKTNNSIESVLSADVLALAQIYIERYPLLPGGQ
ncbi:MAG: hypothetical protein FWF67_07725 [Fibromonadales bacterium]|nr:hypothetical protein [Fibromonadales bacterium]